MFVISLAISCAWMLTGPAYPAGTYPVPGFPAQYPGSASAPSGEHSVQDSAEPDASGSLPAQQAPPAEQAPEESASNEPGPGGETGSTRSEEQANEEQVLEGGSGAGVPPRYGAAFL
jgi:hypothetical protein